MPADLDTKKLLKPKHVAFLQACLIGLLAGLGAVAVRQGSIWLSVMRLDAAQQWPPFWVLGLSGAAGGLLSGWLVQRWGPETTGSGIPQVKAALYKFPMALNLRVALVKLVSGIIALGSGFPLGREGPTVQIGAGLAGQISNWGPKSNLHRRHLLAAGAGAGLAAAFHAPIAGVLFVVEELLKGISSTILGTAILACFVASLISQWLGGGALDVDLKNLSALTTFSAWDIFPLIVLGVITGVLGAFFNNGIMAALRINDKLMPNSIGARVAIAGLMIGIVTSLLPENFRNPTNIKTLLETGGGTMELALVLFFSQFLLILIAYGSGAPGGLFAPSLVLGAALGFLTGSITHTFVPAASVPTYVLSGMAAFFSAVARVPVTAIVIVFEMTNDLALVLPLMITSIVAYLVAEEIAAGSVYDRILELWGMKLPEPVDPAEPD